MLLDVLHISFFTGAVQVIVALMGGFVGFAFLESKYRRSNFIMLSATLVFSLRSNWRRLAIWVHARVRHAFKGQQAWRGRVSAPRLCQSYILAEPPVRDPSVEFRPPLRLRTLDGPWRPPQWPSLRRVLDESSNSLRCYLRALDTVPISRFLVVSVGRHGTPNDSCNGT